MRPSFMSTSFRLALLVVTLSFLLSGCFPGTVLRCEVFEGDCAFVDEKSYVYLRPQNFDNDAVFIERGSSKDLTVWLAGSSEFPNDNFTLEFEVSDYRGFSASGISLSPALLSVRAGSSETLWINVAPDVKPGIYQGKVFALKHSIYAVLDVAIAITN
jgi:hypothetical protein